MAGLNTARLKGQLLTSGLSQKDNPLFQIINSLIDSLSSLDNTVNGGGGSSGGGGDTINNFITNPVPINDSSNLDINNALNSDSIGQMNNVNIINNYSFSTCYCCESNEDATEIIQPLPAGNFNLVSVLP